MGWLARNCWGLHPWLQVWARHPASSLHSLRHRRLALACQSMGHSPAGSPALSQAPAAACTEQGAGLQAQAEQPQARPALPPPVMGPRPSSFAPPRPAGTAGGLFSACTVTTFGPAHAASGSRTPPLSGAAVRGDGMMAADEYAAS